MAILIMLVLLFLFIASILVCLMHVTSFLMLVWFFIALIGVAVFLGIGLPMAALLIYQAINKR